MAWNVIWDALRGYIRDKPESFFAAIRNSEKEAINAMATAALTAARSVRTRLFTADEGGDQHCQVGRIDLATREILDWLDSIHNEEGGSSHVVRTR